MGEGLSAKPLLMLSLAGAPVVLFVLRRFGRFGGPVVVAGCGTLFVRDVTIVTSGVPARLKPLPRLLLFAEVSVSATATLTGLWAWIVMPLRGEGTEHGRSRRSGEGVHGQVIRVATTASVATLVLHAVRMAIYLSPGQGRISRSHGSEQTERGDP
ncbi:MAG: hypothetical protein ACLP36_00640 [Acidimicrobiales bacterium]